MPGTKSVTFDIRTTGTNWHQFTITYKDKDDLFEAFMKKIAELDVPLDNVLSVDGFHEPSRMNNADHVLEATTDMIGRTLYVIDDADKERSSSPRCDDFADRRRGCCSTDHNLPRHTRTSNRSRGHHRLSGRPPHHQQHHHHHQNPVPAYVPCSCLTLCPSMGTVCGCGCSHGY